MPTKFNKDLISRLKAKAAELAGSTPKSARSKYSMRRVVCAGQCRFSQRHATNSGSRFTGPPHAGHFPWMWRVKSNGVESGARFSFTTCTTAGITSPAFSLEAGYTIWVGDAAGDSIGVDTPGDLAEAERRLSKETFS